jgi:hypothetical protein
MYSLSMEEIDASAFYIWMVKDERTGKLRKTTYRMQQATALERYPGATPILSSKEIRTGSSEGAASIGNRRPCG